MRMERMGKWVRFGVVDSWRAWRMERGKRLQK